MFTDDELIKKKDIFDPIEDNDDIDWKHNPFDSLHGSRHLSSSITIFIGSTAAGSRRTLVANTSMNSRTKALSLAWSCRDPSKVILDPEQCLRL
jgi:hypothetical protein